MKRITMVKHHPCTQLAHLYEHMFLATAAEFMYQQGQYQLTDYMLDGHTYPGGIIIIKSIWHSVDATRLANKILTLPTDFGEMDNEPVSLALYRLLAEEPNQLYVADSGRMMHELRQLDSRPWQNIDNIKRLNSSTSQISGIIYSTNQPSAIPRKLYISFQLTQQFRQQRPETLPLFYEYVHFLNLSISQKLSLQFGAYTDDNRIKYHAEDMSVTNTLHLSVQSGPIQFADIIRCVQAVARDLRSPDLNQRFADYLHSISYTDEPSIAPDIDRMLLDLGILLGSDGWHAIATPDNVNDVAQATQIIAKYGNQSEVIE
jgi:hypothetical protein